MTEDMNENPMPDDGEAQAPILDDQLAKTEAELAETKDRLLRTLAESENQRRRMQREAEKDLRYASEPLAKDLLDVGDNLRRALSSIDPATVQDERIKSLLEGVAATERSLLAAFERNNLKRIDPAPGERFDFNLHQAMFEVENSGQPPGSIVQVLQAGYQLHDRLLRAAMVGVAKGEAAPKDTPHVDQTV
jgi:molecular chaperone GrpE